MNITLNRKTNIREKAIISILIVDYFENLKIEGISFYDDVVTVFLDNEHQKGEHWSLNNKYDGIKIGDELPEDLFILQEGILV